MILLDHCMPRRYQRLLSEWGYPVALLTEHLPADAPDSDVLQTAQQLDAVVLTVDLDFANIIDYPPKQYAGIVVLRYQARDQDALDQTLKTAFSDLYQDDMRGTLIVVSPRRYRVRQ